jgi:hypothetical protein
MNNKPIINTPLQGRTLAVVGDVYRFVATGDDTNGKYAIWEALVPPGSAPPPHVHSREIVRADGIVEGRSFQRRVFNRRVQLEKRAGLGREQAKTAIARATMGAQAPALRRTAEAGTAAATRPERAIASEIPIRAASNAP